MQDILKRRINILVGLIITFILIIALQACMEKPLITLANSEETSSILDIFIQYILPFIVFLIIREITVWYVHLNMLKGAKDNTENNKIDNNNSILNDESKPNIQLFTFNSENQINPQNETQREQLNKTSLPVNRLYVINMIMFFIYFILSIIYVSKAAANINFSISSNNELLSEDLKFLFILILSALVPANFMIVSTIRYRVNKKADIWIDLCSIFFFFVFGYMLSNFISQFDFNLNGLFGNSKSSGLNATTIFTIVIVIHLFTTIVARLHWRKIINSSGNKKVLILRVFGSNKNTTFTFGRIMRQWRYLGSYFTIVDPSYVRYEFRYFSPDALTYIMLYYPAFLGGLLFVFFAIMISVIVATFSSGYEAGIAALNLFNSSIVLIVAYAIAILFAVFPLLLIVKSRFVNNTDQIKHRLEKIINRRVGYNLIFRSLPMYCYEYIWKKAVDELIYKVDTVLMDLRGYSDTNKGCEYEVGILLNSISLNKIVFLLDQKNEIEDIQLLIQNNWKNIPKESPNYLVSNPNVNIYVANKHDQKDIRSILTLLIMAANNDKNNDINNEDAKVNRVNSNIFR